METVDLRISVDPIEEAQRLPLPPSPVDARVASIGPSSDNPDSASKPHSSRTDFHDQVAAARPAVPPSPTRIASPSDMMEGCDQVDNIHSSDTLPRSPPPPVKKPATATGKPMSPEKAALAAIFDSIQMPAPHSPSKSPRKASFSLASPSKVSSPTRIFASDQAALSKKEESVLSSPSAKSSSNPVSWDSSHSRSSMQFVAPNDLLQSHAPPSTLAKGPFPDRKRRNMSTPIQPFSSSSPSVKLSDLSLTLDNTGTHEMLIGNDNTLALDSFLGSAADVTIDDSFDVSRARAKFKVRTSLSPSKGAPNGMRGKSRISTVPEATEDERPAGLNPTSDSVRKREGDEPRLRLGVGRFVKNAAGDDTVELNTTSSFVAGHTGTLENIMDESGEASLLFGNSFSLSSSKIKTGAVSNKQTIGMKDADDSSSSSSSSESESEGDKNQAQVQRWAGRVQNRGPSGARTAPTETHDAISAGTVRSSVSTSGVRGLVRKSTSSTASNRSSVVNSGPVRAATSSTMSSHLARTRAVPSASTSAAASGPITPGSSRLLKPRASLTAAGLKTPSSTQSRSSSAATAGAGGSERPVARATSAEVGSGDAEATPIDLKTPMRSRRKSTFTTSRPPVSGPARRRESLLAQHPPLTSTNPPSTPGRAATAGTSVPTRSAGAASSSPSTLLKTPTVSTTVARTVARPRPSLTSSVATPKASLSSAAVPHSQTARRVASNAAGQPAGVLPRPRASLVSRAPISVETASATGIRTPRTSMLTRSPSKTGSLATTTPAGAASRPRTLGTGGITKSASQPSDLATPRRDVDARSSGQRQARTLAPRASMSHLTTPTTQPSRIAAVSGRTPSANATSTATSARTIAAKRTLVDIGNTGASAAKPESRLAKPRSSVAGPNAAVSSLARRTSTTPSAVASNGFGYRS